jgi:hypothetical protein
MDANNNAIVAIMEQNWKSWAMVICRCTFKKDMLAKIVDNLIPFILLHKVLYHNSAIKCYVC